MTINLVPDSFSGEGQGEVPYSTNYNHKLLTTNYCECYLPLYAFSLCCDRSSPIVSSVFETLRPIVACTTLAMTKVMKNVKDVYSKDRDDLFYDLHGNA